MADWPDLDALKLTLDVSSDDFDEQLGNAIAAGIARVKRDVGSWDEDTDTPDEPLANAALRAAVLLRPNADPGVDVSKDAIYLNYLSGHRRRFNFA